MDKIKLFEKDNDLKFHHIGYAFDSINVKIIKFLSLGYQIEGKFFIDEIQGIKGCFMTRGKDRVELLENLQNRNVLTPWINAGINPYHTAFMVEDLKLALHNSKKFGAKIISGPTRATAFNNNKIAFIMLKPNILIELIEK